MSQTPEYAHDLDESDSAPETSLFDLIGILARHWKLLVGGSLAAGVAAFGIASLIPPTFTARTTLLPPQPQQSSAAIALSQLGALSGIAGGSAGIKTGGEQYVSLMQSVTVSDRIIDELKLMEVYRAKYRVDARRALEGAVRITAGKKDGFLAVEVDDNDPQRAADIANAYVRSLRHMTNTLAVTEAQQRRAFFEEQLQQAKSKLIQAQVALQASGFNEGALKAEPKAAAEGYARLRAEVTSTEVRLQTMRRILAEDSPELQQLQATLAALRQQVSRAEQKENRSGDSDYISRFREFKYQETLFELFARQYELARVDESREGGLIQVVDVATPPERKSKPKRGIIALVTAALAGAALGAFTLLRHNHRLATTRPPSQN